MLKLMSSSLAKWFGGLFGKKHARIGLYGPPNAGKTTLANRIARDFTGETVGSASPVPHETRRVRKIWDDAFTSLKRPDFEQASAAADRGETAAKWRKSFPNLVRGLDHESVGPLVLIADSIDRTRGYAIDLAETAMNQTFQQTPAKA